MRHIGSLIAGLVVAPLVWGLLAFGLSDAGALTAEWQADNLFDTVDLLEPLAFLAIAAVLFGLLATLRLSPVGPLVAGAIYVGLTISLFFAPLSVLDAIPNDEKLLGRVFDLRAPLANGTLFVLGLALMMAAFSQSRWRQWPVGAPPPPVEGEDETQAVRPTGEYAATSDFSTAPTTSSQPSAGDSTAPIPSSSTPTSPSPDLWGPTPPTYPGSQPGYPASGYPPPAEGPGRHSHPGETQSS